MCLPAVLADADRMRQVLWNLLLECPKIFADPGEIRVVARCVDGQLAITVTDRGVGIPACRAAANCSIDSSGSTTRCVKVPGPARIVDRQSSLSRRMADRSGRSRKGSPGCLLRV